MTAKTKEDIRSYGKGLELYCPKNTEIKIINTSHHPVMIAEYKGNTFPVHVDKISIHDTERND